jgi:hypothetical protein
VSTVSRADVPEHVFSIPELDFSQDLFAEPVSSQWFRLGAWTIRSRRDERGVEDVVSRQSLLLAPGCFTEVFGRLESIGNVIDDLGKPQGSVHDDGESKEYRYAPFHTFEFVFTPVVGEPLAFLRNTTSGMRLFINPDLWLFLGMEERAPGSGIWWDPRRGIDVLRQRVIEDNNLEIVEIRTDYLLKYLQARQMSLVVGHYRHLHFFNPSPEMSGLFVQEDVVLGSPEQGAKALLQNWGLRKDIVGAPPFLQRRLHLWFEIRSPAIDVRAPWAEPPPFDPYTLTLPTRVGPVAPARWKLFREDAGRIFEGGVCDFMDRVYFRQEVLTKYEGASGFEVADDGSVSCRHYWGLVRSTSRLGNELLATAIGDFAQGVPFEEWPHWRQYAVQPPSPEMVAALGEEQTVPEAVNALVRALGELNMAFSRMAASFGVTEADLPWRGSLDSLAGRQLKWVYPANADDDEFLKRATLMSTLVIDGLEPPSLRKLLDTIGRNLHLNDENPPRPLGSRNLLQRVSLVAVLAENFRPDIATIPTLVRQAEGNAADGRSDAALQAELVRSHRDVRDDFGPLAFLYELRVYGGLAHTPNKAQAAEAAAQLGLPRENWHRADCLRLLNLVAGSVRRIGQHLEAAARSRAR